MSKQNGIIFHKLVSIAIILTMVFASFTALELTVKADNIVLGYSNGLKYETLNANDAFISSYNDDIPKDVIIPEQVTFNNVTYNVVGIQAGAFWDCDNIETIKISDKITQIYYNTFTRCTSLVEIDIGDGVTQIGDEAFMTCLSLEKLALGKSIKDINITAFSGCVSLAEIIVDEANPYYKVDNKIHLLSQDGKNLIYGAGGATGIVTIPNSVETINKDVFRRNHAFIPSTGFSSEVSLDGIVLNDGLVTINEGAFYLQKQVKEITIPDSVEYIGFGVFDESNLEKIVIGKSVEYIGMQAFRVISTQPNTTITFRGVTPPTIDDFAFPYAISTDYVTVYVPRGTKQAYQDCFTEFQYYYYNFIEYDLEAPTEPEQPIPPYTPSEPETTGSGSSSSGGSSISDSDNAPSPNTSSNVLPNGSINQSSILSELNRAIGKSKDNTIVLHSKNAKSISASTLKAITTTASKSGKKAILYADTMSTNGKVVEGRLYIEPEKFSNTTIDLKLGIYARDTKTNTRKTAFKKWFKNELEVVSCEQQGSFGARVHIAVKIDLSKLNTKTLIFYSYDRATNSYSRITDPAYFIDNNGYLHFYTDKAGDIIITDRVLERK